MTGLQATATAPAVDRQVTAGNATPTLHGEAKRLPELDGVRGVAALSVMLYHLVPWSLPPGTQGGALGLLALALKPGWLGVDLFFVLSGFLITRLLLRDRGAPRCLRTFYIGRALRILPGYGVVVAIMWFEYPHARAYILLSSLFLSNLAHLFSISAVNGVLWSLAIEEHFYLWWPVVVRTLSKRCLLPLLIAVCCVMPFVRAFGWVHGTDVYYYTWFRLDGLAWGGILALSAERRGLGNAGILPWLGKYLLGFGALLSVAGSLLGILSRTRMLGAALQQSCVALCFAGALGWLIGVNDSPAHRILRARPLRWLGTLSYGTYLMHMLVLDGYNSILQRLHYAASAGLSGILLRAVVTLTVTILLAAAMHRWIETPCTRIRRRLTAASGNFSDESAILPSSYSTRQSIYSVTLKD